MIQTQQVKCPYCGYERTRSWSPSGACATVVTCEQDIHHDGCGRSFAIFWHIVTVVDARKIEGQEEPTMAAE